ncbi:hypothetical protein A3C91_01565 [Candidatus Azambacteria bacterium RIFCSPHIGHO2_02_FULL_52_12]|uniref:YprB ribonuclease H-like domain-containing protein n=1 Tax=Candidatus Azambacteria bacterium RIFCSPLOWO2_01_FULL_46_25 TaxID=1797298 RepID=A0A1F5BTR3_9BACT|nr:MAG: hypothetical protein A3C91_01565 [Candidatus Azambacteria bacterium RIFCSPHIGHO2_02_FULL_52_12]OGD34019.1 MAG: hypothetical protein A2988_00860 [Candidatus Azambacteria bacterium RIFCSPLOWO2_01_FULL_46_25]OGD36560.1 MAG: hypothetical protein A2850_02255 [Candidatus Azambacteria bacterium RIFCSPHIGHO2_01_FULL_51_74]
MKDQLVLDLETQFEFAEVGGRDYVHLLKVSLVGVYSYLQDEFLSFEEHEIPKLEELLKNTDLIVGFNTKFFDYTVLQPYLKEVDLKKMRSCDIMEDATNVLGFRVSLDSVAKATLGTQKSGHGLDAIRYFREGNMDALRKYCLDDVRITRDVFEYGRHNGKILFVSRYQNESGVVPVTWKFNTAQKNSPASAASEADVMPEAVSSHRADVKTGNYSLF